MCSKGMYPTEPVTGQRPDPWARIRAWWGIAELDEDAQAEWLAQQAEAQAENEMREVDRAS